MWLEVPAAIPRLSTPIQVGHVLPKKRRGIFPFSLLAIGSEGDRGRDARDARVHSNLSKSPVAVVLGWISNTTN